MARDLGKPERPARPLLSLPDMVVIEQILDSGSYEEIAWETGATANIPHYSLTHLVRTGPGASRPVCGVSPGWARGSFGPSDRGRCTRCFRAAARELGLL